VETMATMEDVESSTDCDIEHFAAWQSPTGHSEEYIKSRGIMIKMTGVTRVPRMVLMVMSSPLAGPICNSVSTQSDLGTMEGFMPDCAKVALRWLPYWTG